MAVQPDEREQTLFDPPESPDQGSSLGGLGASVRRHWFLVLVPIALLLGMALFIGMERAPSYTAKTRLAVGGLDSSNPAAFTGFADAAQQLAQTYSRSVQGDSVVREVAQRLDMSPQEVRSSLSGAPIPETPVFTLSAKSDSPERAIELSLLASRALVREAHRASNMHPARLLERYRRAVVEKQRASGRVKALALSGGAELATARSELEAADARSESLRTAYATSEQVGTVPLQIIEQPSDADSDRRSVLQLLGFAALVLGLVLGMALAVFRDSRLYEAAIAAPARLRDSALFKRGFAGLKRGFAGLKRGFASLLKRGFAGLKRGFAGLKRGFAGLANLLKRGFAGLKRGFASLLKRGFAGLKRGFAGLASLLKRGFAGLKRGFASLKSEPGAGSTSRQERASRRGPASDSLFKRGIASLKEPGARSTSRQERASQRFRTSGAERVSAADPASAENGEPESATNEAEGEGSRTRSSGRAGT